MAGHSILGAWFYLKRLFLYPVYGGAWWLRRYERHILQAVQERLPPEDALALSVQIKRTLFIQRHHADRIVTFSLHKKETLPKFSETSEEVNLVNDLSIQDHNTKLRVSVIAHRGFLSSLEFSKSPKKLKGDIVIKDTTSRTTDATVRLNAEEHP